MKYIAIILLGFAFMACSKKPVVEISMASEQRMHAYSQDVPVELTPNEFMYIEQTREPEAAVNDK